MKDTIRVAQIKIMPAKGDLAANHARLMSALREVPEDSLDVVVTPECFLDGYVSTEDRVTADNIIQYAVDPMSNPLVESVARWARSRVTWFLLGCTRRSAEGVFNSVLVFDRNGQIKGAYDKTHCQTHDKKYRPGQKLGAFASDFGPFGIMICADRRWPETVRSLALQGARVIFNPTYGGHGEKNLWMMRTRSYESEIFIAFTHPFQALLTDPAGNIVLNETREDVLVTVCEVDLSEADRARAGQYAHLRDRRPDLYTEGEQVDSGEPPLSGATS